MELVYLWVEDYKNIKKQGFNFSPRFKCKYDENINELTIDEKKDYVSIFPKNINITAIVGENGSGKSSIIELLYSGTSPIGSYFYIFDIGRELVIKGLEINNQPNGIITNNKINKNIFIDTNLITLDTGKIQGSLSLGKNKLSFVYFSTFLEWNEKIDTKCIIGNTDGDKFDISSAYLINYYSKNEYEMNNKKYNFSAYQNQYKLLKNKNIQNTINMLKNSDIELPIKVPEKLYISINHSLINKLNSDYQYLSSIKIEELSFLCKIKLSFLINFLEYSIVNFDDKDELLNKLCIENESSIESIFEAFVEVFGIEQYKDDYQINPYIEYFTRIKNLLMFIVKNEIKIKNETLCLEFHCIDNDFIENYQKITLVGLDFFYFEWFPNLSTGQENLLFQFANFYTLKIDRFANKNLKNNVYIFIDEGENTLHPKWQKKYISYLIEFFSLNFAQRINFIFSSHSPFILSDLPKENVIFLKDGKQEYPFKDKQTFGANIHTLLSDGFFMSDGLMGEFAKEKINSVYRFLKDEESDINSNEEAKVIIDLIGEPLIKRQLQTIYNQKFKIKSKDEIIQELQNKIIELEKTKND